MPLRAAAAGAVDLKLDDVDVQALAKSLPSMPLRLQGQASGSIQATIPAAGPDGQRQATGKIDLSAKALTVQNIPTDNLHADVDYKAGVAEYHLKGDSLGGHFTLDGKVPFTAAEKPADARRRRRRPAGQGPAAGGRPFPFRGYSAVPFVAGAGPAARPSASCTAGPTSTCRSSSGRTTP